MFIFGGLCVSLAYKNDYVKSNNDIVCLLLVLLALILDNLVEVVCELEP